MKPDSMRNTVLVMFFALAGVLACGAAWAQDPFVRTQLSDNDDKPVWVGQSVTLVVELLAPGYFDSAANFDLPDPDGVLLMKPSGSPVVRGETIDGTYYTVQRHELRAWPMDPGNLSIPPFSVRFAYKLQPLDEQNQQAMLTTQAVPLSVNMPPGAQDVGTIISARNLQVVEKWEPQPGAAEVKAGTALKRTVTFSASDVPGMLFPQFPAGPIDGLGVYAKSTLDDRENRGALIGSRRDEITYVCQQVGQFTIPSATFTWFDLDSGELQTQTFPAQTLKIIPNDDLASANTTVTSGVLDSAVNWRKLVLIFGILVILLIIGRLPLVRRKLSAAIAYLRPVHLQPLNPEKESHYDA